MNIGGRIIRLNREPTAQGLKFINSMFREALFGGAKRGSKTVTLGQLAFLLSWLFPGNRVMLCRNDFTDLHDTTLHEFFVTVPRELFDLSYGNGTGHNKGEREIRTKSIIDGVSSSIIYRGLGNMTERDIDKVKSLNIGALLIDEASEVFLKIYLMLNAQLTWVLPDGSRPPYFSRLTSNPEPGWVKERFVDDEPNNASLGKEFIPALPMDNPHLPPGWEQDLRLNYDPEFVKKYLDGSWDVVEGMVFQELTPIIHDLPVEAIPYVIKSCDLMGSIDHADTGIIAATVNGINPGNDHFVFQEYYEKDVLISHACKSISNMFTSYCPGTIENWRNHFKYVLIDPSTVERTLQSGNFKQAVIDAYRYGGAGDAHNPAYGIPCIPAWNALGLGIEHMKQRLHPNPMHLNPWSGVKGAPHLYICRALCPNTWKEMKEWRRKISPMGRVTFLGPDHGIDTVRYVENSILAPPKGVATDADLTHLSGADRRAASTHRSWAAKWDESCRAQGDGSGGVSAGSWY